MKCWCSCGGGQLGQTSGIGAVFSPYDDHRINTLGEHKDIGLSPVGRLANGVVDLTFREALLYLSGNTIEE